MPILQLMDTAMIVFGLIYSFTNFTLLRDLRSVYFLVRAAMTGKDGSPMDPGLEDMRVVEGLPIRAATTFVSLLLQHVVVHCHATE